MVKLADTYASGAYGLTAVQVQILSGALWKTTTHHLEKRQYLLLLEKPLPEARLLKLMVEITEDRETVQGDSKETQNADG